MIKKSLAAVGIAVLAVFSAPLAANADYVPEGNIQVSDTTPAPGETVTVTFADGSFDANEDVTVTVDAPGDQVASLSFLKAATVSEGYTATAAGGLVVTVTLPANASGTYTVTAVGADSGNVGIAEFTVTPADAGAPGLPVTGAEIPVAAIWIAGGAVVLGGVLLLVMGIRRRAAQH